MKKSKNKESDYQYSPEKKSEKNIEDDSLKTTNRAKSIAKKKKINKDVEKQAHNISPTTETTTTPDTTPTKRTKSSISGRLSLENSNVNPKKTKTTPGQKETPPLPTERTTKTSPEKSNKSYKTASETEDNDEQTNGAKKTEENDAEKNETKENDAGHEKDQNHKDQENNDKGHDTEEDDKDREDNDDVLDTEKNEKDREDNDGEDSETKKRKREEVESPGRRTRATSKKQELEKKVNQPVTKRKRDTNPKKVAETSKKMAKKKGKNKLKDEDYDDDMGENKKDTEIKFKSLRARATVKPLYEATKCLTPERKTIIRQMGFGSMLDFQFDKTPSKISYVVLKNLNTEKMEVSFPSGSKLKITPRKIWEVLGIPMGKNKLESDSPGDDQDELIRDFKAQFGDKKFITTTDLSKLIQRTTNTDFMIQMNYLMLFSNCIVHCDNSSRLVTYVLRNIKSTDVINEFDWCKFVWDVLRTSKVNWKDDTNENWYYGPSTVLLLLYMQYTKLEGIEMTQCKWPGIRNWSYEDLVNREMLETVNDEIGLVEVLEDDKEESENVKEDEKNKLKELIYEVIEEKFEKVLKEKKELEDLLKENLQLDELFSGDKKLESFVERFIKEFIIRGTDTDENNEGTSGGAFWGYNEDTNMTTLDRDDFEQEPNNEEEEAKKEAAAKEREETEK